MNPIKTTAKDVFLYLGIIITLSVSVGNMISIIFTALEKVFVDPLTSMYVNDIYNDGTRMALASLVILFPLYVLLSWFASREVIKNPEMKELLARKITIYIALFVTTCTLVGTLISVVYTFLGGELSALFGWKAFTVVVLASSVFGYYFYTLRRDYKIKTKTPLIITIVASLLVLASVIYSISILGTPNEMRMKKLDDKRLSDLSTIQSQIFNEFLRNKTLPKTVSDIVDPFGGFVLQKDPVTKENYEYQVVKNNLPAEFKLCANFETVRNVTTGGQAAKFDSPLTQQYYPGDMSPFWNHESGRVCFTRTITQDILNRYSDQAGIIQSAVPVR